MSEQASPPSSPADARSRPPDNPALQSGTATAADQYPNPGSGAVSLEAVAPTPTDDYQADDYRAAVRDLLSACGIGSPDEPAINILLGAAQAAPDDKGDIATAQLFIGAITVGQSLADATSYPASLARALTSDAELWKIYVEKIRSQYPTQSAAAALERLKVGRLSPDVTAILRRVAEAPGEAVSDALVQILLSHRAGILSERLPMDRIQAAVEKLRATPSQGDTLASEVDAHLTRLGIPATEQVRLCLIRANHCRNVRRELIIYDVLLAVTESGAADSARRSDPSAMLYTAIERAGLTAELFAGERPPLAQPLTEPAKPNDPLRLTVAVEEFLRHAHAKQRAYFLNAKLGTKSLVATLLTSDPADLGSYDGSSPPGSVWNERLQARFREVVWERVPDKARQWFAALELQAPGVPRLDNDQPWSGPPRDHLGITNDAIAVANVAAAKATSLPLAFGVFGDWGSGKTFFMRLVHDQIERVARQAPAGDDGFEHAIVQIQFNAWHYAETNLWASLVGHVFDELDRWMTQRSGGTVSAADQILQRLDTARQLTLEAASELVQRRRDHAKAGQDLATAQQNLSTAQAEAARAPATVWRGVLDTARDAVANDPEIRREFAAIEAAVGLPGLEDNKARLQAALEDVKRSASAGNAALAALRSTFGNVPAILLALAALVVIPALAFGVKLALAGSSQWVGWREIASGVEAIGGLLGAAAVLMTTFAGRLKTFAERLAGLRQQIDAAIRDATVAEANEVAAAAQRFASLESEVDKAKAVLQKTGDQVAAALQEYAEETGTLRIRRFVRARAGDQGYGKHLGLVSTIRKDFEQLESLMLNEPEKEPEQLRNARKHYEDRVEKLIAVAEGDLASKGRALTEAEKTQLRDSAKSLRDVPDVDKMRFGRIVLYIDDLDRCEPEKVVEVLQAVNMLLSFRLFVVMVAVDARWLSRSLEKKYPDFFGAGSDREGNGSSQAGTARPVPGRASGSGRRATAADYLEKIFQVPYWVPRMTATTGMALVGDLTASDRVAAGNGRADPVPPVPGPRPIPPPPPPPPPSPGAIGEDDQPETETAPEQAPGLTPDETQTLAAFAGYLGGSPRRARRFVNIYRVAKASLTTGQRSALEAGDHRPLAAQLAIATGAPNTFAKWVDEARAWVASQPGTLPVLNAWIASLTEDEEERANLKGVIEALERMPGERNDMPSRLIAQAPLAMRFSFDAPSRPDRTAP